MSENQTTNGEWQLPPPAALFDEVRALIARMRALEAAHGR